MLEWDRHSSHWKLLLLYYNPEDKRLLVRKRYGLMATINWANPIAWIMLGVLLGIPALGLLLRSLGAFPFSN
jgi:uncharacterized membrane protein